MSLFELNLRHEALALRRTKIVATIGPASSSPAVLGKLIERGLDVARINFSHGDPEEHLRTIGAIRRISAAVGRTVAILGDLCGPKIRVGRFRSGAITLVDGSAVTITTAHVLGEEGLIPSQHRSLAEEVSPGHRILLDDGGLELEVTDTRDDQVMARVLRGGVLRDNKGMNLPDTSSSTSALTEKDRTDAAYCVLAEVDYVALSFVRRSDDIEALRRHLENLGGRPRIVAKIEKPEALENIDDIVRLADALMIARGDLGVEVPSAKVPLIQAKLIEVANQQARPVIVATQMLESMVEHPRPTRAEITDVSTACQAGADAVMLSAETASGRYPVEAFDMMDSILRETEAYRFHSTGRFREGMPSDRRGSLASAVGSATALLASDLGARCVFSLTRTGNTARSVSAERPAAPVIALTDDESAARWLHLMWGVYPHLVSWPMEMEDYLALGEAYVKSHRLGKTGDHVILLSGVGEENSTNSITVHRVG